jgi:hypothetical protein
MKTQRHFERQYVVGKYNGSGIGAQLYTKRDGRQEKGHRSKKTEDGKNIDIDKW